MNSVKAKAIAASEDGVANGSSLADVAAEYKLSPHTLLRERTQRAAYEYLQWFRDRNKLSIRRITHRGVKQREELQLVADAFGCAMRYAFEMNSVVSNTAGDDKYNYVYNMDQASIYFDMNPSTTISFRGERHVDVVKSNSFRASVFLCASATG
ncbi:Cytochrome P450 [Phytophthora cinnamomi]|uniref:Cytochrome P450 n=1 Tax=Phytophthora cinnamomi TaxID=4785 RepID=UPI0035599DC3|nr:Cytochrome P450 [Phytophthora cinnamomi]